MEIPAAKRKQTEPWAAAVSNFLNPLVLVVPLFLVLSAGNPDHFTVMVIATLFFGLLPLTVLLIFKARQKIETLEIRKRHNRHLPFIFGITCYALGYIMFLIMFGFNGVIQAAGFALVLSSVITALITLKWKISIHCTAISLCSVFMLFALWPFESAGGFITSLLVAILVCAGMMWSRVTLGAHSPAQTIAGILFGLFLGLVILSTYPI
ncbi:MAG: phosphatase PAP2 family protein [Balneolia bacterium]|nr:phosphatase PAP2 family protein [Balneolia bacterium]